MVGLFNYSASSASSILNQLVTAAGRDALGVMVYQDPLLSVFAFIGAPIAILSMRKIILRSRKLLQTQFGGGLTILETIQGMRVVKFFTLEDRLRQRMYESIDSVEATSNRLAVLSISFVIS
jgi:ATP-binding cassette subfamily B protein